MSAVKERIRQYEERLTPSSNVGTQRVNNRRASPMTMTPPPRSSFRKPQSTRKLDSNTPFMSPPRPKSTSKKAAVMANVTNVPKSCTTPTRSSLPQPKKLDMTVLCEVENQVNESHTKPSSVQKRKEELERYNCSVRRQLEMRDEQLGRSTKSINPRTPSTPIQETAVQHESRLELILSMSDDDDFTTKRRKSLRQSRAHRLKRFWECLYAFLAILELLTCQGMQDMVRMDLILPQTFIPSPSFMYPNHKQQSQPQPSTLFGVVDGAYGYWGRKVYNHFKLEAEWIRQLSWQEFINKAFLVAIFIHTVMESWSRASSSIHEKQQKEQRQALASATKVTKRSKRRFQHLETSSSNRHFIMRWTRNKIKWRSATTEILLASCVILLLRLLFLPFLKRNRIVVVDNNSRQTPKIPFLSPIYVPKDGLEMTVEIAGRTLSYGEAILLDVLSWLRSRAVTHFRRKVKEYAMRFATLALTRPWEASARVQTAFTVIRWTKFVAPLIGTCNKLRGQVTDYRKKRHLKHRSERANLLWSKLVKSVLAEKRTERAVLQLQRSFRIKRQRTLDPTLERAVVKLQRRFRQRASESRIRVRRAKKRLSDIGVGRQIVSYQHRELADSLRREIRVRSRKNFRLLLRPNTSFSLTWKRTTIACVLIEVSYKLLAPLVASKTGKLTLDELIVYLLTPAAERLAPLNWHQVSFVAVEFLSQRIAELVSTVSFLDVFVTFFTGELNEKTGALVPKPFFARWILPGVALQLIVNPTMKDISAVVKKLLAFSNNVGPLRVFHVALALFPIARAIVLSIIDLVFHFVDSENRKCPSFS